MFASTESGRPKATPRRHLGDGTRERRFVRLLKYAEQYTRALLELERRQPLAK
jgi:hypothetical protein